ncbi:Predicted O-linked N-acetylglucosamine transferase, SPINDLY family [Bradyrhizobium erythrophlei]|jgi:predicted O-linked N-acetylglucosamine transferase (SPINDLY family)|uniref:protein O-GlcNAc transferase n=1 Tax=Bradyrhizobium erythrophlei TaxID=1437360 RepID=A0A1M5UE50_9BRAD|nr:Predicted O-linked N-acetylglucosamine transferase, SPINDLY family [Bradyrhizobium erythrophlei]
MNAGGHSEQQLAAAMAHHRAGRLAEAERLYRLACDDDPKNARAFHLLGVVAHQLGRPDAASLVGRAVTLDPRFAEAHNDRGAILAANRSFTDAVACFERAVSLNPGYHEARNNLARGLRSLGRFGEALVQFEQILKYAPDSPVAHFNLASVFELAGRKSDAESHYCSAISLRPDFVDAHIHLALLLLDLDRLPEALVHAERAVALRPDSAGARNNLGNILRTMGLRDAAIAQYEAALGTDPSSFMAHYNCGVALRGEARIAEARRHFAQALALKPNFLEAELALCMAELPALYNDEPEIAERRDAYAGRLAGLCADTASAEAPAALAETIGSHQPFYLPYQGRNDRELQVLYGSMVCGVMAARYDAPVMPAAPGPGEPIRLGIVSGFFRQHSNWKIPIKGWLSELDRTRFHVSGYYTSGERDDQTEMAATLCRRFVQGPLSLDAWRRTILDDAPDILIFPEIGMDKVSAQLAAQRLAAVQCASWGHPVTSGFPTIDYFISSDLMEPAGAAAQYSERLIRLPNLSIYYEPSDVPARGVDRTQLGLRADSVAFWCCQSLPKYLPQFDQVFARIAAKVPGCQFTFIEFAGGRGVTEMFRGRLDRAFLALGLKAADHCVFLPRLAPDHFVAAIGQCDVVLDSIGWSGCNSILESLVHNVPIVTLPGDTMRARHAAAILERMGMRETTARTVDDYVSIAVSLGRDAAKRAEFSTRIANKKQLVYRDRVCIAALEAFLDKAARPGQEV